MCIAKTQVWTDEEAGTEPSEMTRIIIFILQASVWQMSFKPEFEKWRHIKIIALRTGRKFNSEFHDVSASCSGKIFIKASLWYHYKPVLCFVGLIFTHFLMWNWAYFTSLYLPWMSEFTYNIVIGNFFHKGTDIVPKKSNNEERNIAKQKI